MVTTISDSKRACLVEQEAGCERRLQKECWNIDLLLLTSAWRGTMITHCLRHPACLTARVDDFCDQGHTMNHIIVVRISGRSLRKPVLNLTSRKPNEQVRWFTNGVVTRMLHMPFDQDTESLELPLSSVLSGWLVLGVELPLKRLSLWNVLRLLYCQGGWYLALQHNCPNAEPPDLWHMSRNA